MYVTRSLVRDTEFEDWALLKSLCQMEVGESWAIDPKLMVKLILFLSTPSFFNSVSTFLRTCKDFTETFQSL